MNVKNILTNYVNVFHDLTVEEINLLNEFKKIKKLGWIKGDKCNNGSAGILIERLLNNNWTNFEIPDYDGIEIKTKYSNKEEYITLFCATPDSFLFEIKRLLNKYGYPDKQYPNYNIFNLAVYSKKYSKNSSNYYFKLETDYDSHNIILNIYDNNFKLIDNDTKWSFELLEEKLLRKLQKLAFIEVKKKYISGEIYYRYENVTLYNIKNFDNFINLIDKGKIKIVFRIGIYKKGPKFGQIYDHGTSFCIKVSHLEQLFQKVI